MYRINDIVPISDTSDRLEDAYVRINFYEKGLPTYYLSARYGVIYDKELFYKVVGQPL